MVAEHLGVYLRLAAASVRATARRPAHLAARTLAAALIVAIEVAGVMLMLDQFGSIGGWRPAEVVVLFGLGFAGRGWPWCSGTPWRPARCRSWSDGAPSTRS